MENYPAQALLEALDIAVKRYVVQALTGTVAIILTLWNYLSQALAIAVKRYVAQAL
jgi:hypothetical protein